MQSLATSCFYQRISPRCNTLEHSWQLVERKLLDPAPMSISDSGSYPAIPVIIMWNGNNIGGSTKRSVGIAMQIAVGSCGGVIASFMLVSAADIIVLYI